MYSLTNWTIVTAPWVKNQNVSSNLEAPQITSPIMSFSPYPGRDSCLTFVIILSWLSLMVLPLWHVSINNMVRFYLSLWMEILHEWKSFCIHPFAFYLLFNTVQESFVLQNLHLSIHIWSSFYEYPWCLSILYRRTLSLFPVF